MELIDIRKLNERKLVELIGNILLAGHVDGWLREELRGPLQEVIDRSNYRFIAVSPKVIRKREIE